MAVSCPARLSRPVCLGQTGLSGSSRITDGQVFRGMHAFGVPAPRDKDEEGERKRQRYRGSASREPFVAMVIGDVSRVTSL